MPLQSEYKVRIEITGEAVKDEIAAKLRLVSRQLNELTDEEIGDHGIIWNYESLTVKVSQNLQHKMFDKE